jgi:hypothetical protein
MSVDPYILIRPGKCKLGQGMETNQTCLETFGNQEKIAIGGFEEGLGVDTSSFYDFSEMSEYFDLTHDKSNILYAQVLGNTLTKTKNTRLFCEQGFRN